MKLPPLGCNVNKLTMHSLDIIKLFNKSNDKSVAKQRHSHINSSDKIDYLRTDDNSEDI